MVNCDSNKDRYFAILKVMLDELSLYSHIIQSDLYQSEWIQFLNSIPIMGEVVF
jgi:hypothetical protein